VAPRTLKPAEAARLIGMSEEELRAANRIPKGMLVRAGSTLLVPRDEDDADVAEHIADHGLLALTPEGRPTRKLRFKAGRKGDSVAAVARRYRVSAAQVAQWNGVSQKARFKAGQTIVVEVRATPPRRAAAAPKKRASVAQKPRSNAKSRSAKAARTANTSKATAPPPKAAARNSATAARHPAR
jgi:membrane-bound lytic murein transglycosylase D